MTHAINFYIMALGMINAQVEEAKATVMAVEGYSHVYTIERFMMTFKIFILFNLILLVIL